MTNNLYQTQIATDLLDKSFVQAVQKSEILTFSLTDTLTALSLRHNGSLKTRRYCLKRSCEICRRFLPRASRRAELPE